MRRDERSRPLRRDPDLFVRSRRPQTWAHTSAREARGCPVDYLAASDLFVRFGEVFEGYLPARQMPGDSFELNTLGVASPGRCGVFRLGDLNGVHVGEIRRWEGKVEL
jgi:hypothetical protein